jgi:hypothetical protein
MAKIIRMTIAALVRTLISVRLTQDFRRDNRGVLGTRWSIELHDAVVLDDLPRSEDIALQ